MWPLDNIHLNQGFAYPTNRLAITGACGDFASMICATICFVTSVARRQAREKLAQLQERFRGHPNFAFEGDGADPQSLL